MAEDYRGFRGNNNGSNVPGSSNMNVNMNNYGLNPAINPNLNPSTATNADVNQC